MSIFLLVSVGEETGLNLSLLETRKTGFLATRPIWVYSNGWQAKHAKLPSIQRVHVCSFLQYSAGRRGWKLPPDSKCLTAKATEKGRTRWKWFNHWFVVCSISYRNHTSRFNCIVNIFKPFHSQEFSFWLYFMSLGCLFYSSGFPQFIFQYYIYFFWFLEICNILEYSGDPHDMPYSAATTSHLGPQCLHTICHCFYLQIFHQERTKDQPSIP